SITGKVELVYEGEQEGAKNVAYSLLGKAIRRLFVQYFPDPELSKKRKNEPNPYESIVNWFRKNELDLAADLSEKEYQKALNSVPNLEQLVKKYNPKLEAGQKYLFVEFILHGLAEYSLLSKNVMEDGLNFSDLFNSVFSMDDFEDQ